MYAWRTLSTCPLFQEMVTSSELVSVIMPLRAVSPRQNTLVPSLSALDSLTVIVAPAGVDCHPAWTRADSRTAIIQLSLRAGARLGTRGDGRFIAPGDRVR